MRATRGAARSGHRPSSLPERGLRGRVPKSPNRSAVGRFVHIGAPVALIYTRSTATAGFGGLRTAAHGSVQKEGIPARRTKAAADAFSPYRHRATAPENQSEGDPAITGGGEPGTPRPGPLGPGRPGQPACRRWHRRRPVRAAGALVLLGALPGRSAARDRAAADSLERDPARAAALAERPDHDPERRSRARDGAAGRASVRTDGPAKPLRPSGVAPRGNRIRLRAGARAASGFRETAARAPAITTAQHPAGR
jgi:hypothetical protein